jgi:hypothetical protein
MKVGSVMTADVVAVHPEMPFKGVAERLVDAGVSGLPVIHDACLSFTNMAGWSASSPRRT